MNKTYTIYDTRLKITGLLEGSEYQFRVTAVNSAGYSQPSDTSVYILCKDPTCKTFLLKKKERKKENCRHCPFNAKRKVILFNIFQFHSVHFYLYSTNSQQKSP